MPNENDLDIAGLRNEAEKFGGVAVRSDILLSLLALAEIGRAAEVLREFLKADPKFDRLVQLIDARKDG